VNNIKIILDSADIDEAMQMYLQTKGIIADDATTEIDYTKGRGDTGLTAEISVLRSDTLSDTANVLPGEESGSDNSEGHDELDSGNSEGSDTFDTSGSDSGTGSLFGETD